MNDHTEVLPAPLQEDSFDIVMRGYGRGQVDEYIKRTKRQLEELESRLARAEREAEDARRDRDRARNEVASVQRKLESREPSYEDLGERLTQILQLAQEEAEERRERVVAEAERARAEAQQEAEAIREEVDQTRSEAATEADQMRSEAREESQRVRNEAAEATERLRGEAEQRTEQLIGDAEHRSREIEEGAKERVAGLERQHQELLAQLSTVRDSLQTLLPQREARVDTDQAAEAGAVSGSATEFMGETGTAEEQADVSEPGDVNVAEEPTDSADETHQDGTPTQTVRIR